MSDVWPLPRYAQLLDFLPRDELRALTDWVIGNRQNFGPGKVATADIEIGSVVDTEIRISLTSREFGPLRATLERRMRDALPALERATGCESNATSVELELAAHGNNAHYAPHLDISYGDERKLAATGTQTDRTLSAVYYFHREPKGFSGGELRLFRFGSRPLDGLVDSGDWIDIEPLQNSLVAFPSWVVHEVRTIHCPSRSFEDYRFAVNCWYRRDIKAG